jgi:hypothetical protein
MSKKKDIDWVKVLLDLRDNYKPIPELAEELNQHANALRKIMSYDIDEPKYSVGVRLLELHEQHCCKKDTA